MTKRHIFTAILVIATMAGGLRAQNTTNVPTSMYGIGELTPTDGGKYAGIGSAGIALNRQGFMNTMNPACITSIDTTCFIYDIGVTTSYSRYAMLGESSSAGTGNISRITIGMRLLRHWYAMVGVAPYSSVGYLIATTEEVEGTGGGYVSSVFEGDGGLYKLYMTNAFLFGRLSIGANIGMISGTIEQTETQENAVVERKSNKGSFYADFGLHYALTRNWSVGATYGLSTRLKQENTLTYTNSSTTEGVEGSFRSDRLYVPEHIAGGVTYTDRRWTVTGDYSWTQWSKNSSLSSSVKYIDQTRANVGSIYVVDPRKPRSLELMLGVGYSNSYVRLKGGKMYNLDLSAGVVIPIRETTLALGVTWRKQMNTRSNLMQEDRFMLNLNVTVGERLSRGKIF